jgi:hypothetical protein
VKDNKHNCYIIIIIYRIIDDWRVAQILTGGRCNTTVKNGVVGIKKSCPKQKRAPVSGVEKIEIVREKNYLDLGPMELERPYTLKEFEIINDKLKVIP